MSDFKVICPCGHEVTVSLTIVHHVAVQTIVRTYRSSHVCPACAMNRVTLKPPRNRKTELLPLSGPPYHVALAQGIRQRHMDLFREFVREHRNGIADDMMAAMTSLLNERSDAGWWIKHEMNTFRPLIPYCHESIRSVVIHAAFHNAEPIGTGLMRA